MSQETDEKSSSNEGSNMLLETKEYTKEQLKAKSSEQRKKGYLISPWQDRGGKNPELILDMEKPYNQALFYRIHESKVNYNQIIPKTKSTQKYPQYVIVDKLDKYLQLKEQKTTGMADHLPTKDFLKIYLLHILYLIFNCKIPYNFCIFDAATC